MGFLLKDLTDVQLKMQNNIWKKGEGGKKKKKDTGVKTVFSCLCHFHLSNFLPQCPRNTQPQRHSSVPNSRELTTKQSFTITFSEHVDKQ